MFPQSLLLIDDNDDCITLVKFVLRQDTNWQILIATDAKEGIAKAKLEHPDVILLDIVMPEFDGLDIYKILKSDFRTANIPIIFTTAMTPIVPILESEITEKVDVIIKPFDVTELAQQITRICDRYYLPVLESSA